MISKIGSGGFGNVFLVSLQNDRICRRRRRRLMSRENESEDQNRSEDDEVDPDQKEFFAMKIIEKVGPTIDLCFSTH